MHHQQVTATTDQKATKEVHQVADKEANTQVHQAKADQAEAGQKLEHN